MRHSPHTRRRPRRREGVILIVVLTLLALLAIVGLTFQVYGETARPVLREFRAEAASVVEQTGVMAALVGHDLRDALREDADFSDSFIAIDELADRAATFKARVRTAAAAEADPTRRTALLKLCGELEDFQLEIDLLRRLIEELERGGTAD